MHHPLRSSLSLALALALLAPLPGGVQLRAQAPAGQQAPPQPNQPNRPNQAPEETAVFGEVVDVRVVNLEVVVVDRQGNRVHGLTPQDFRLLIDGKPTPIGYFSEIAEGRAVENPEEAETTPGAPSPPAVAGVQPGADVGTSYVVFIDDLFTTVPRNRNLVLKGIIDQLDQLGPADRMAVVAYDGRKPELLSNWSNSRIELRQALERGIERKARGLGTASEVRSNDAVEALNPNETPAEAFGGIAPTREDLGLTAANASEVASYCAVIHRMESKIRQAVTGVTATMRSLAGAPGRKVMLLVTGGWPRSAEDFVIGQVNPNDRAPDCKTGGPKLYEPIHEIANRIGFTLYPVLAAEPSQATGAEVNVPGKDFGPDNLLRFSEMQETTMHLARQTGGKAFAAGTRTAALKGTIEDTRSYYWLGFTPTWQGNDRAHRVKVEVTRPGLEVRNRAGFLDLSKKAEVSYMVESALLFGNAPGTYPLPIRLGPFPKGGKNKVKVPLQIGIPMQLVTMIEQRGKYVGELELRVAVVNEAGDRNDLPVIPVKLSGAKAPQPGQVSIYSTELELRRQKQDVVVALFDPPTGNVLEAMATLNPGG